MSKIYIVHVPNTTNKDYEELIIPNGILYIYNFLLKNKFEAEISLLFADCLDDFVNYIEINSIVGFSVNSSNKNIVFNLAEKIKSYNKSITVIAGGPFISLAQDSFLNKKNFIDYFFKNESEFELLKFLKNRENFKKITYCDRIENLDLLGYPAESDIVYSNILTSRGCPGSCIYCSSKKLWGRKIKLRSSESVISEIDVLYKKKVDYFVFSDDTFTIEKNRTVEILDGIQKNKLIFDLRSRTDFISEGMAEKLAQAGCVSVSFGIESGSKKILETLKKNLNIEKSINIINEFKKAGILVNLFFIVGNPGETENDINLTCDFIKKTRPDWITVYGLHYYPGCELNDNYHCSSDLMSNSSTVYYDNLLSINNKKTKLINTFKNHKNIKNVSYYKNINKNARIRFRYFDFKGDKSITAKDKTYYYQKALEYYESPEIMYKLGMLGNKKMLEKAALKFYFQLSNDIRKSEDFLTNCKICFNAYGNKEFIDFANSETIF